VRRSFCGYPNRSILQAPPPAHPFRSINLSKIPRRRRLPRREPEVRSKGRLFRPFGEACQPQSQDPLSGARHRCRADEPYSNRRASGQALMYLARWRSAFGTVAQPTWLGIYQCPRTGGRIFMRRLPRRGGFTAKHPASCAGVPGMPIHAEARTSARLRREASSRRRGRVISALPRACKGAISSASPPPLGRPLGHPRTRVWRRRAIGGIDPG
jgi:hypothetical protein